MEDAFPSVNKKLLEDQLRMTQLPEPIVRVGSFYNRTLPSENVLNGWESPEERARIMKYHESGVYAENLTGEKTRYRNKEMDRISAERSERGKREYYIGQGQGLATSPILYSFYKAQNLIALGNTRFLEPNKKSGTP